MADDLTKTLMEGMRAQLEQDEKDGKLAGLTVEDLADAISHPKAGEVIAESMALEPTSVQAGQPAPDFSLPYLPPREGEVTLSDHFGRRPVALVFAATPDLRSGPRLGPSTGSTAASRPRSTSTSSTSRRSIRPTAGR